MAMILIMSLGMGISMVVYDADEKYQYGYLAMQLAGLLGFPLFMAAYYLVTRNVPGFVFPRLRKAGESPLVKPLMLIGWFCLLHELGKVVSGIASGTMDRGYAGDILVDTPFGWWSAFVVFSRLQTLGFLLVPLIWRESQIIGRVIASGIVGIILFLHFVAASRGAVFFPLFILLVGCYMFLEFRRLKFEVAILVGVIALFPFVTIMSYYRNTEAFRQTDIRNIFQKLGTMKEGLAQKEEKESDTGEHFAEAGRSYIGVADSLIYEMTPSAIAYEGARRLDDLLWLYVPIMFSKGVRPVLLDGNAIVVQYTGIQFERSSIAISWPAEMYRRWGWAAVPIGLILYGIFYGAVFRYVYNLYLHHNALLGFIICGLLFSFFNAWFFHTVLSTCWGWLYDIPKHLLLLGGLYFVVKILAGGDESIPGALELMGAEKLSETTSSLSVHGRRILFRARRFCRGSAR